MNNDLACLATEIKSCAHEIGSLAEEFDDLIAPMCGAKGQAAFLVLACYLTFMGGWHFVTRGMDPQFDWFVNFLYLTISLMHIWMVWRVVRCYRRLHRRSVTNA